MPATNVPLGEFEVDCLWPDQRVVAEIDTGVTTETAGRSRTTAGATSASS
jgi:hypothetical protein